jgi:hypothetical protein
MPANWAAPMADLEAAGQQRLRWEAAMQQARIDYARHAA